jgi:hypothetical protein
VADALLVVSWLILAAWSLYAQPGSAQQGPLRLIVWSNGSEHQVMLAQDQLPQQLSFEGPVGLTIVDIAPGKARVLASPCSQQICRLSGWLSSAGDVAACVPNRLVARVVGRRENQPEQIRVDGISR